MTILKDNNETVFVFYEHIYLIDWQEQMHAVYYMTFFV